MKKRLNSIFLFFLTAALLLPLGVFAENAECSLRVKTDAPGMRIRLYALATEENGESTVAEDFAEFAEGLAQIADARRNAALSEALCNHVSDGSLTADKTLLTDEKGEVLFSGLARGVYLVLPERLTAGGFTYTVNPFIVRLPDYDAATGTDNADALALPKTEKSAYTEGETCDIRAVAVWSSAVLGSARPDSISVQLRKDGEITDTAELNSANNWSHTWTSLPSDHKWTVTAKALSAFYMSVNLKDETFVVTVTPEESHRDSGTTESDNEEIPNTGLLWWPVPALGGAGLLFILLGLLLRKRKRHE